MRNAAKCTNFVNFKAELTVTGYVPRVFPLSCTASNHMTLRCNQQPVSSIRTATLLHVDYLHSFSSFLLSLSLVLFGCRAMPLIVGLTGGIATGKSSVSSLWRRDARVAIVDADAIARSVVARGRPSYYLIRHHFGNAILQSDGNIDRAALGRIIFRDSRARKALNLRTHPFIIFAILTQMTAAALLFKTVVVLDVPLLFESKTLLPLCSRVVVIATDAATQMRRLRIRDTKLTQQEAQDRINSQMPMDEKVKRAHYVIENIASTHQLEQAANNTLQALLVDAASDLPFRVAVCAAALTIAAFVAASVQ